MKDKEINKVFKQVLKTFIDQMLDPCDSFVDDIDNCKTYNDLKKLLEENADQVYKSLDGELECEHCSDKDDEIEDLEQQVADAKESGLVGIIAVGSDSASNQKVIELADLYNGFVYPALGWHPWYIKEEEIDAHLELIASNMDKAVAVGEVGLDFYRDYSPRETQLWALRRQLELAVRLGRPVIIHCRQAESDLIPLL